MRFVQLTVDGFQGIEHADVAFGPNLNVLFGPNDLGKSTLAIAIRAALLLPPTSAEAQRFGPWHRDEAPRVRLVFQDDTDQYWRIKKMFGDGPRSAAELGASKDGKDFTTDAKNREVEDRIRKLLRWGIPSPGGKGAPRGFPESFLQKVLLAPQTEVDDILRQGLATDNDDTGKLRLSEALAALAQDPKFKALLNTAQGQVDQYFAPGGGKKRGKDSAFTKAGADVKRWREEYEELRRQDVGSEATEKLVVELRAARSEAVIRQSELADALDAVRKKLARTSVRADAAQRLEAALAAVKAIDARVADVREAEAGLKKLEEARAKAIHTAEAVQRMRDQAELALRTAEEVHRRATSDEVGHERELRGAQMDKQLADLTSREHQLKATNADLERVAAAEKDLETAWTASKQLANELEALRIAERESGVALKWRVAAEAADGAAKARQEAGVLRSQAADQETAAAGLDSAIERTLPTSEQLKAIRQLFRSLENAEAALGGGMTITVRPGKSLSVVATLDGTRVDRGLVDSAITLDAERSAHLMIADLVEVDVQAGAPEKRKAAAALRKRWEIEGAPALLRAGASDLDELERKVLDAETAKVNAARLRVSALNLCEQASEREKRALELAEKGEQAAERDKALIGLDRAALEKSFLSLGRTWESALEKVESAKQKVLDAAAHRRGIAERSLVATTYKCEEATKHVSGVAARLDELKKAANVVDSQAAMADTKAALMAVALDRTRLEQARSAVAAESGRQLLAAEEALADARKALDAAKLDELATMKQRDAARSAFDTASGQRDILRAQVGLLDRGGAEALVVSCEKGFVGLPIESPVTEADVESAERASEAATRALVEVTEQLHTADGGLQKVGGAVLRDNLVRVQEALDAARERERSIDLDAESWKMLVNVLRDVENEEGTHLGRALAGPVTVRLRGLTSSRYGDVELGPTLQAQGIKGMSGAPPDAVLEALSVGTKDQLATLLRITIAQELRSAIILDDHLVHTDPQRLVWFRKGLREAAAVTQVIVLTCRPHDYLAIEEMPGEESATRDLAGGGMRAVDLGRVIRGWSIEPPVAQP
jgi:hypothetical protein